MALIDLLESAASQPKPQPSYQSPAIAPIPTRYKGYHFRSRLEARWAVFFDAIGLCWEYEPEGFDLASGRYLPDFKVLYRSHWEWFECKGDLHNVTHGEWARMLEFEKACGLTVLDGTPAMQMYLSPSQICGVDDADGEMHISPPYRARPHAFKSDREGAALWCVKERLWYDNPSDFFYSGNAATSVLDKAVAEARSARFEHGHSGAS